MFPDNPCSLLPKFEDESCAGIWKLPKELSHVGGGVWNELKTWGGGWNGSGDGSWNEYKTEGGGWNGGGGGGGGGGMNGAGLGRMTTVMEDEKDYCYYYYCSFWVLLCLLIYLIDFE